MRAHALKKMKHSDLATGRENTLPVTKETVVLRRWESET